MRNLVICGDNLAGAGRDQDAGKIRLVSLIAFVQLESENSDKRIAL